MSESPTAATQWYAFQTVDGTTRFGFGTEERALRHLRHLENERQASPCAPMRPLGNGEELREVLKDRSDTFDLDTD